MAEASSSASGATVAASSENMEEKTTTTAATSTTTTPTTPTPTPTLSKDDKVRAYYIFGKALDAKEGYNKLSEKFLSKAVKLAPNDVDTWNALANCFWKKGDLQQAVQCFQSALSHKENAHSLRELSILRRQLGGSNDEMVQNMISSLSEAKKAISLNVTDTKSWYVLGNAHLAQFFQMKHNPDDLSKALKAYQRALGNSTRKEKEKEKGGSSEESEAGEEGAKVGATVMGATASTINPDLYFNRATVHKYLENYDQAINDFKKSREIDPELPATNMIAYIERSCLKIQKLIQSQCRLKPKKLNALAGSILTSNQHRNVEQSIAKQTLAYHATQSAAQSAAQSAQKENNEQDNGSSTTTSGSVIASKTPPGILEIATISELKPGRNYGKMIPLKLLTPVIHETHDPPA